MAILTRQTRQRVLAQTLPSSIAKRVNQRLKRFDASDFDVSGNSCHSVAFFTSSAQKQARGVSARKERQALLEDDFLLLLTNAATSDDVSSSPETETLCALSLVIASTDVRGAHWAPGHIYLGQTTASGRHYDANDAYLGFTDAQGRLWDATGVCVMRPNAQLKR